MAGDGVGRTQRTSATGNRWGEVNIYLVPFLRPSVVRSFFPDAEIGDYTDALGTILEGLQLDTSQRNVVLAHQFVTAAGAQPETCDSEQLSVGGLDRVDGSVFSPFDYTALGHLHGPQRVGSETIRYAGSPWNCAQKYTSPKGSTLNMGRQTLAGSQGLSSSSSTWSKR